MQICQFRDYFVKANICAFREPDKNCENYLVISDFIPWRSYLTYSNENSTLVKLSNFPFYDVFYEELFLAYIGIGTFL